MAYDTISPCAADALRRVRQVKINGILTGITILDECIAAVKEQSPGSDAAIRDALMKKIRTCNYIPPCVEEAYATAILEEYHKALLKS